MSIRDFPEHVQRRAKAILDREARRILNEELERRARGEVGHLLTSEQEAGLTIEDVQRRLAPSEGQNP